MKGLKVFSNHQIVFYFSQYQCSTDYKNRVKFWGNYFPEEVRSMVGDKPAGKLGSFLHRQDHLEKKDTVRYGIIFNFYLRDGTVMVATTGVDLLIIAVHRI